MAEIEKKMRNWGCAEWPGQRYMRYNGFTKQRNADQWVHGLSWVGEGHKYFTAPAPAWPNL